MIGCFDHRHIEVEIKVQIDDLDHLDQKAWDDFISTCPFADHYHLSGWGRVIRLAYGWPALYFTAWEGGALRGVLPVIVMGGRSRKRLVSLPFLDYGGICADHPGIIQCLYKDVQSELSNLDGSVLDLRQRREMQLPLASCSDKVTMILGLENNAANMWNAFKAKLRNQIRKAEKEQLETQWTGSDGLRDFYSVYTHNMRDLGSPPHSFAFFERVLAEFSDTRILLVRLGKKVIGGGLCLVFKDTMLMPWASSLRTYLRLCPNNLLYWEAIRTACENGLIRFDFGRSSRGSGTYKFKKQWGALEEPLYWQSNISGGDLLDESTSQMLGFARKVWRYLPVCMTRFVGPTLRRRISN